MVLNPPSVAGAGQFWILGVSALVDLLFFTYISTRLGKAIHSETDGCLLSIANVVLVIVGGMGGLLFFHFPYNLLNSMFWAVALPGALTYLWVRRTFPPKHP